MRWRHEAAGRGEQPQFGLGTEPRGQATQVVAQHRRKVRVDHRGVAPRHDFHQRRHLVRNAHIAKAHFRGQRCQALLMRGVRIGVEQANCERRGALLAQRGQGRAGLRFLERRKYVSLRRDPLIDLRHVGEQRRRLADCEFEQLGAVLIADPQHIGKAARGDEGG